MIWPHASPPKSRMNPPRINPPLTTRPACFQFSLGTFLFALLSVAVVVGMLAEEVRLTNHHMRQVNRYSMDWFDQCQSMTREDVRSYFDVPPTTESVGKEIEVFRWNGWLLAHEYHITFSSEGHPIRTTGGALPRLGLGAAVLALLAGSWLWLVWRWLSRRRAAKLPTLPAPAEASASQESPIASSPS